ncbi:hypothetical protein [Pseudonocardia sp. TRM90224]|uniref:hypothetical protein n=1 Tax=Pseudonocardia sp. TRM90224 TaxID=2812678 RepID=UPI001E64AF6F|nr:hypothetical protein [Pseudonocardia sp. TRM90224]
MQTGTKKSKTATPPSGGTPHPPKSIKKTKRNKTKATGSTTTPTTTTPTPATPTTGPPAALSPVAARVNLIRTLGLGVGIAQVLDAELQQISTITDPLANAQAQLATLTKIAEFTPIVLDAEFLAAAQPNRRATLDGDIVAANASDAARQTLAARLAAEVATIKNATTTALSTVQNAQPNQLAAMTPDARIDLVRDLVHGDPTRRDERRAALITLYRSIQLDPAFKTAEVQKIDAALATVKNIGGIAAKRLAWATLSRADKMALLEDVLKTHSTALGIPGTDIPALKLYSDDPNLTPTAEGAYNNGFYDGNTNTIFLNDRKDAYKTNFDDILDTLVHENTHNRQRLLVEQLSTPNAPAPGTVEHQQATLFALNSGTAGYIEPPDNVYPHQPIEEHAFLAGGIAGRLFRDEARTSARQLQAEIATFRIGKTDPLASTLDRYTQRLDGLLTGDQSAGHIARETQQVARLLSERKVEATSIPPGHSLILELDKWITGPGIPTEKRDEAAAIKVLVQALPQVKQARREIELELLTMRVKGLNK